MEKRDDFLPAPQPDKTHYKGLNECLADVRSLSTRTIAATVKKHNLSEHLSELGFRKFVTLSRGEGSSGLVIEACNGQVIRFQYKDNEPRPLIHEELQPILSHWHDEKIYYEILPKLQTQVSERNASRLESHVNSKNYTVEDFTAARGDIGVLPDGTPVGVDKDAIDEPALPHFTEADKDWLIESDKESIFPYLKDSGYISKQEAFFPALMDGRPRGVLSDADIERLKNGQLSQLAKEKPECFQDADGRQVIANRNLPEFIREVQENGWYPSQAIEIMCERGSIAEPTTRDIKRDSETPQR